MNDKLNDVYIFNSYCGDWWYKIGDDVFKVQPGDVCNPEMTYSRENYNQYNVASGSEIIGYGTLTNKSSNFKSISGIYTKEAEIYTPISSTAYDPAKTYYSVNFTDLEESGKSAMANNDANFETITTVTGLYNPSGVFYFDGVNYTEVNNGDLYHEGAYYVRQDNYTEKSYGELAELGYAYHNEVTPFWEIIENDIKNNAITEVVLNSKTKALAEIDYTITQRLMHCSSIKTLDLGEVQIDHFDSYDKLDASYKQIGTFVDYTKHYTNKVDAPIEKLVLPHIKTGNEVNGKMHYHVPSDLCLTLSDHLHKIVMSDNATCLERQAFGAIVLTDITLNEGLRVIGEEAFNSMHADVLVIPSTMEYIGVGAFGQGYVHDVYFLGTTAPIVEMDAFGSKAYVNNNANYIPNTSSDPISHGVVAKNPNYAATREFYYNGDYAAAVLHLPKNLTPAQRAAYTDVTRDYHVFDTYRDATDEEEKTYGQEGSNVIKSTTSEHCYIQIIKGDGHDIEYKYINGNKTNQGKWDEKTPTQDFVMRTFWNGTVGDYDTYISSLGGFTVSTYNSFNSGIPGAGITGGQTSFYDYYVGSTYHWPGQSAYNRSYAVATNNILWDGKTTIAQGIVNKGGSYTARKYDINCDGDMTDDGEEKWADGSEYIGLHQFVLVTSDIEPEQTPEEIPFKTIKGGNWYSFCYPVNMTVKQVREVFGEGTQVCKFNQVDRVVEGDDKRIRLYFTDEQCLGNKNINKIAISANVSYMIRPSTYFDEDDENYANMYFKFSDYQLDGKQVPQETNVKAVDISSEGKVAGDDYTFIGQYMTQADGTAITMPKYSYFLRNTSPAGTKVKNQKHKLSFQGGTTGKWNVYTSIVIPANGQEDKDVFFTGTSSQNLAKTSTFFGFAEEDKPTEVESVKYEMVLGAENNPGGIYNLNGQLLGNTTVGLKKGIYIQQGKKFIIR